MLSFACKATKTFLNSESEFNFLDSLNQEISHAQWLK